MTNGGSRRTRGRNFFGGSGAKLDFVSFHKKGNGSAAGVVSGQRAAVEDLSRKFPSISKLPFFNDEADPEKSWWKRQELGYFAERKEIRG